MTLPFDVEDWQYEVANGDTRLGYTDWVQHQVDMHTTDVCDVCAGTGIHVCEDVVNARGEVVEAFIERCDLCTVYEGDLDAMQAYAIWHNHAQIGWQQNREMRWIDANALIPLDAMQDFGTTGQTRRYKP